MSNVMILYAHHTDKELADKVRAGQIACFEVLVRRHTQGLYRVARACDLCHVEAREALKDTHMDAFRTLSQSGRELSYRTWLAKKMVLSSHPDLNGREEWDMMDENTDPSAIAGSTSCPFDSERFVSIRQAPGRPESGIERLAAPLRVVYVLSEIEGFSPLEIRGILNISDDQLQDRLHKAKALLRKSLRRWYQNNDIYQLRDEYCEQIATEVLAGISGRPVVAAGIPSY